MRLPHLVLHSRFFSFSHEDELITALGNDVQAAEEVEIRRLAGLELPPVSSQNSLATMVGINPGMVWSLLNRTNRHYNEFAVPRSAGPRIIHAPRVGLKIIQKWLAHHIGLKMVPQTHVFGFVPGRSHIQAASQHCNARWVYSVDIRDFFPTTPLREVETALQGLGYNKNGAALLASLFCIHGGLAQGAPSSPVLSNLVFTPFDGRLQELAQEFKVRMTRYADDIVFSGTDLFPEQLPMVVRQVFEKSPWTLSEPKTRYSVLPNRLKVHGLLVHGPKVRLTKKYRNKIRAYRHLLHSGKVAPDDLIVIGGHVNYAKQIENK